MFRWPASSRVGAGHRRYAGHGCVVDAVGFSWDDRFVLSVGMDGAALVWRHWNELGERELSEEGSDMEEEEATGAGAFTLLLFFTAADPIRGSNCKSLLAREESAEARSRPSRSWYR